MSYLSYLVYVSDLWPFTVKKKKNVIYSAALLLQSTLVKFVSFYLGIKLMLWVDVSCVKDKLSKPKLPYSRSAESLAHMPKIVRY